MKFLVLKVLKICRSAFIWDTHAQCMHYNKGKQLTSAHRAHIVDVQ